MVRVWREEATRIANLKSERKKQSKRESTLVNCATNTVALSPLVLREKYPRNKNRKIRRVETASHSRARFLLHPSIDLISTSWSESISSLPRAQNMKIRIVVVKREGSSASEGSLNRFSSGYEFR